MAIIHKIQLIIIRHYYTPHYASKTFLVSVETPLINSDFNVPRNMFSILATMSDCEHEKFIDCVPIMPNCAIVLYSNYVNVSDHNYVELETMFDSLKV